PHPREAAGVRPRGQRHARPADRQDVGRPRHRVRHRGDGARRPRLDGRGRAPRGAAGTARTPMTVTDRRAAQRIVAENRKALHDYHILETFEAGIVLQGTEVKSIREGRVNLRDSFARVEDGEVWVYNIHISPYSH